MRKNRVAIYLVLLMIAPSVVLANGVSPILNFFHKDTWVPASIVTIVIILLEAGLLRWKIKNTKFKNTLWISLVYNMVSSLTGSVLLIAVMRDSFFIWDSMALVLPLFAITLATEIPLIHALFKKHKLSWGRACWLGVGINIFSYVVVILLEIGLLFAWLSYTGHLDNKETSEWNNTALLEKASGLIYVTESKGSNHGLTVFDCRLNSWKSLEKCPSLDPNKWDVEGETCAFVRWTHGDWKDRTLVIATLPEFEIIREISPVEYSDAEIDSWQGISEVAVSPDQRKLAILFRYADTVAKKNRTSYFHLGDKCKLIVVDIESGTETARATRWASNSRICWLPDSESILFKSYVDDDLYNNTQDDVSGGTSYGVGYAKEGQFKSRIYLFDYKTEKVTPFIDGYEPSLALKSKNILIRNEEGLMLLDSSGNQNKQIDSISDRVQACVVSAHNKLILAEVTSHAPFAGGRYLVLIDINNPDIRHILDTYFFYRMDWSTAPTNYPAHISTNYPRPNYPAQYLRHYLRPTSSL